MKAPHNNNDRNKTMITGITLPQLAAQIKTEQEQKRDFIAPTSQLRFQPSERGLGTIAFTPNGDAVVAEPTDHCLNQICQRSGIPKPYADRMHGEHASLLAT